MNTNPTPQQIMEITVEVMSPHWVWGTHDCCTAACDVFQQIWGVDPMAPLRGKYSSAFGAAKIIQEWGGMVNMTLSLAEIALLETSSGHPGAIGLSLPGMAAGSEGRCLMICIDKGSWAAKTEEGLAILPIAELCWGV